MGVVSLGRTADTRHSPIKRFVAHPARVLFFLVVQVIGGGGGLEGGDGGGRGRGLGDIVGRGGGGDGRVWFWAAMRPVWAVWGEGDCHGGRM